MSAEGLLFVFESMVGYQTTIQDTQQLDATTTNDLSILLMTIYKNWETTINDKAAHPPSSSDKNYGPEESQWATELQVDQSESQEAATQIKPYVDADTQTMQSDGNSSQEVSQLIMTVDNILSSIANLLQSLY
ncbi:MAG: hypothetical protein H7A41_01075 [Chlamydiales bacterium]|nr:hypothetical protein [Chlamydiia bacterium]MCP5503722.1 hypothetical protein [Chlamydiales bacterium]